jgi:hypothetical protein
MSGIHRSASPLDELLFLLASEVASPPVPSKRHL